MVRAQWWLRGVSWLGMASGRVGSFGLGVLAGRIRFLVGAGQSLLVGMVVGLSVWWVVRPSQVVVLSVDGGVRACGVGWRAVVVVVVGLVVVVVVVVVVLVLLVVVVVVVVVLWLCPPDPLALRRDLGVGQHLQPFAPQGLVDSGGGSGA